MITIAVIGFIIFFVLFVIEFLCLVKDKFEGNKHFVRMLVWVMALNLFTAIINFCK